MSKKEITCREIWVPTAFKKQNKGKEKALMVFKENISGLDDR
jgi:hypothetical protein